MRAQTSCARKGRTERNPDQKQAKPPVLSVSANHRIHLTFKQGAQVVADLVIHFRLFGGRALGYVRGTCAIRYLITWCCLRICSVFSMGRASTVCPLPVVVVALNMEL